MDLMKLLNISKILALKILKINLDTGLEVHREYLFQQYINGSDQVAE